MLTFVLCVMAVLGHARASDRLGELRDKTRYLVERAQMLQEENKALNAGIAHLYKVVEPVAFSAVATSTQTVAINDVIKFHTVLVDTHGLYNPNIGVVTVPETGVYEVTLTLYKHSSSTYNRAEVGLFHGDQQICSVYNYYPSDTSATAHSTATVITTLTLGEAVYAKATRACSLYATTTYNGTQLSLKYLGPVPPLVKESLPTV